MRVMVTGGTGTVGSAVASGLVARGVDVSVLTRGGGKNVPAGAKTVVGDLGDPATVRQVFAGFDAVFLVNVVSPAEATEGLFGLNGARGSGVRRIVYLSVAAADQALHLPHFGSKYLVEQALAQSGLEYTVLRPNNFYQNDYWWKDVMLQYGVYPQPIGSKGLSRIDVRDIADGAVAAFVSDDHVGEIYEMGGPDLCTGENTAQTWSEVLGREIRFAGDDLDAWEEQNLRYLPAPVVYDFRLMYKYFQDRGLELADADAARQAKLLGHPPRRFADFAREAAAAWKGGG